MQTQTATVQDFGARAGRAALTPLERYAAGLARLDAAVRAGCPHCSGPVEAVRDMGSVFVECDHCLTIRIVEAN